jgi:hypothetical protein
MTAFSLLKVPSGISSYTLGTAVFFIPSDYHHFSSFETRAAKQAFFAEKCEVFSPPGNASFLFSMVIRFSYLDGRIAGSHYC